jgi:DNA-directed RNA polymerase specialized sigma24 family protein
MARRPAEIVLSAEERAELERRAACYTLPHKVVQRAKLVLYAADGLSNVEIAARLDSVPEVVGRWRSRFARERLAGVEDRARSGRPRRFSPAADRAGQGDRVRAAARGGRQAVALLQG